MAKDKKPETNLALFQEKTVRRQWYEGRWFFLVIDVIAILTDSANPRRYWSDLKRKLEDEGYNELYEKIVQLKMVSHTDGKHYVTDAATLLLFFASYNQFQALKPNLSNAGWPKSAHSVSKKSKIQN